VTLDPTPLFTTTDRAYHVIFKMVTDRAVEEYNRVHS